MSNANMNAAKAARNNEYYTRLVDIEREVQYYEDHFKNKVVYCNCDDPEWSAFWQYFHENYGRLGLKGLIATHYEQDSTSYRMDYRGGNDADISVGIRTPLEGDGDFRNTECEAIMDEADIICTNPPFSLSGMHILQIFRHSKQFLVIGNLAAVTYKDLFPYFKSRSVWPGYEHPSIFVQPDGTEKRFGNTYWYTNIGEPHHRQLELQCTYSSDRYPRYDNYDAIEVKPTKTIPMDYDGIMGVPVSFIEFYDPDRFIVIGHEHDLNGNGGAGISQFTVDGVGKSKRILIQLRQYRVDV